MFANKLIDALEQGRSAQYAGCARPASDAVVRTGSQKGKQGKLVRMHVSERRCVNATHHPRLPERKPTCFSSSRAACFPPKG